MIDTLKKLRAPLRGRPAGDQVEALFIDSTTNTMIPCQVSAVIEVQGSVTILVRPA